jgi:hypothetical protein
VNLDEDKKEEDEREILRIVEDIVYDYFNTLKLLDENKNLVYSTSCMIRKLGSSLDNESLYKMVGKSVHHTVNVNKEQFIMQLSYDLSKLIISYSIIDELDIILFSKK